MLRPNVATTRDRLDVCSLPPAAGMELDYRTEVGAPGINLRLAMRHTLHACLCGLLVAIFLRVTGAVTSASIFVALATLIGLIMGIVSVIEGEPLSLALRAVVLGPVVWLLSVCTNSSLLAVLVVAVLLYTLQLANRMTYHYARRMHANIYLPREVRRRWLAVWKPTNWLGYVQTALTPVADSPAGTDDTTVLEESERRRYASGFLVVIATFLLAVLVYLLCLPAPLAGFAAVGVFIVALVAYAIPAALHYDPAVTPGLVFRILKTAYVSWFTYNIHNTPAPGVFRSPSGSASTRYWRTVISLLLISLTVLPVARYFPVGLPVFGYEAFLNAANAPQPWEELKWNNVIWPTPITRSSSQSGQSEVGLTEDQQRFLSRLNTQEREQARAAFIASNRQQLNAITSAARLNSRPEAMLWAYFQGVVGLDPGMIFAAAMALLACLLAPPAILGVIWMAIGGRAIVHHYLTLEGDQFHRARYQPPTRPSLWEAYVRRLRESESAVQLPDRPVIRERDHFFLGVFEEEDYPVLLSPGVLAEHGHITGDSGAGKSSLGLAPLLDQIVRRGEDSLLVIDLKGDMSLFESVRAAVASVNANRATDAQVPFRWFTNRGGCCTYAFNPFLQDDMQQVTMHQKVEILLKSLGLEYGEGYGTSYYSASHRFVLERMLEANVRFESLRKLNRYFQDASSGVWKDANIRPRTRDDATHLYTTVNSLAQVDALNITARDRLPREVLDQRIDLGALVRTPQVVYFYLHSALEDTAVRAIAKLALYSLLVAAIRRGAGQHRVYAVVDEFQQVVSEDLQIFLRQARSAKIPVILANQTISDLRTKQADLIPTVLGNTRFRQVFSSSDLLQQSILMDSSGEAMYNMQSEGLTISTRSFSQSIRTTEQIGPRLRRNDIIQASNDELTSIVHVTRAHGYSQFGGFPFPIRSMFHIPFSEYVRRQEAPWPSSTDHPGTFTPPLAPASATTTRATAPKQSVAPVVQQEFSDLEKRIDQLEETIP